MFILKKLLILLFFVLLITTLTSCSASAPQDLEEVTLLLDWTPNTNYSGIFAAMEEGYYREEGIDLQVVEAPGSVLQMIATGQAHFGISYQEEVVFARLSDLPVVTIAAVIQHNTSGFASLKERDILSPADFEGKRYGGWGSPVEEATIKALMDKHGADFNLVDIVTTGEVDSLIAIERDADFAWIYYGWTGIEAELKGIDLNFIELRLEEEALDYYTPVIVASEELIAENPTLAERFMNATSKGYRLAMDDPETAARHLLTHAPELDHDLVSASQEWLVDKYQAEADTWGLQDKKTWEAYSNWLLENGLIDKMPESEKAYTNRFVR